MSPSRGRSVRLLLALLLVGLVAGAGLLSLAVAGSSFEVRRGLSPASAEAELQAVLGRWPGPPWVLLHDAGGRWEAQARAELEPARPAALHVLHGLLWDPSDGRLVRASVPAWTAQLGGWKLDLLGGHLAPLESRLGVAFELPDASRHGPGLLVDHAFPGGRRLLVWGE